MKQILRSSALALLAWVALSLPASATTYPVFFNTLTASATVATPLDGGDTLIVDTLVTNEVGALLQSVTFTLGATARVLSGFAAWEVSTAAGPGPRLVGVNIDILDAGNNVVVSDTFAGVLGGFALSTLDGLLSPGTYRLVATGTGVRESSLDVSLSFSKEVPEPALGLLLLSGLGLVSYRARRASAVHTH